MIATLRRMILNRVSNQVEPSSTWRKTSSRQRGAWGGGSPTSSWSSPTGALRTTSTRFPRRCRWKVRDVLFTKSPSKRYYSPCVCSVCVSLYSLIVPICWHIPSLLDMKYLPFLGYLVSIQLRTSIGAQNMGPVQLRDRDTFRQWCEIVLFLFCRASKTYRWEK